MTRGKTGKRQTRFAKMRRCRCDLASIISCLKSESANRQPGRDAHVPADVTWIHTGEVTTMPKTKTPVNPAPAPTDDVELTLLRKRVERKEKDHRKLCVTIERTQRRLEKADKTLVRCVKMLTKLERQRRRLEKAKDEQSRMLADMMVKEVAAPAPEPDPELDGPKRKRKRKHDADHAGSVLG
jgi:hypothetical protein